MRCLQQTLARYFFVINKQAKRHFCWLFLLTLIALILRIWGLRFGLPLVDARPDELLIIRKTLPMGTGDLNPHYFSWPSLFLYILLIAYGFYVLFLLITGNIQYPAEILAKLVTNPGSFFLISRSISAISGAVCSPVLYIVCKKEFNRRAAFASAFFMAVLYSHVRDSHFGMVTVPATAMLTITIMPLLRIYRSGHAKYYCLAGIFGGLAASIKYDAALISIAILSAHWFSESMEDRRPVARFFSKNLGIAAACMIGSFILTSPFIVLDFKTFHSDFIRLQAHMTGVYNGIKGESFGWFFHLKVSFRHGIGFPILILSLAGLIKTFKDEWKLAIILLTFPVIHFLYVGSNYLVYARYIIPLTPFICIFAGIGLDCIALETVNRWFGTKVVCAIFVFAMFVCAASTLFNSVAFNHLLSQPDTRESAINYVHANIPSNKHLGWLGVPWERLKFKESPDSLQARLDHVKSEGGSGRLVETQLKATAQNEYGIFFEALVMEDLENRNDLPEFILAEEYDLFPYLKMKTANARETLLKLGYVQMIEFAGASAEVFADKAIKFDNQDPFYVPFAGMHRFSNPGPTLTLWHKVETKGRGS